MSNIIRIKRRLDNGTNLSGAPVQGSLLNAELAYNEVDGTLYYGKGEGNNGVAQEIVSIGGTGYIQRTVDYASSQLSQQMQSNFNTLTGQIDGLSQAMDTALDAETLARTNADNFLSGAIDDVNDRVDSVLSNIDPAALDSLSEIVSAFQAADSNLNSAISLLANNGSSNLAAVSAQLAQSIADEVSRATDAEADLASDLSSAIADINSTISSVSSQLASDLSTEISRATNAEAELASDLASEISRVEGLISDEENARIAAVSGVQASLDSEVSTRQSEITRVEGLISDEENARIAAVSGVQASLDSEVSTRQSEITRVEGLISDEQNAREAAITSLSSTVDSEIASLSADMVSRDSAVLAEAKSYTDTAIADLVDGAPELLNTLKELASAIGDDENYFVHIAEQITALSAGSTSGLSAEISRAEAAEAALSDRIDDVVSDLSTEVARASGAEISLGGRIDDVVSDLSTEVARASAVEIGLRTDVDAISGALQSEITRATNAENALSDRLDDVENNYLDKTVGGTVSAALTVDDNLTVSGTLEVGSGSATLYVGATSVGVNTESPTEAFEVNGNGKFSGDLMGSGTSAVTGFVIDGGLF